MEDWIELFDGTQLHFMRGPQAIADAINERQIAHGLSMMCRYAGQCQEFYSVAEHSALIAHAIYWQYQDKRLAFAALMHDATEAFLPDIPRPLKVHMPDYLHLEAILMEGVTQRWGLVDLIWSVRDADGRKRVALDPRVKEFDNRILVNERKAIMSDSGHSWSTDDLEPLKVHIKCLEPTAAERYFLQAYDVYAS